MATVANLEAILRLRDELSGNLSKTVKNVTGHIAAMVSFGAAVKLATDSLKAQGEQEDAINKLNLALANQGKLTPATSAALIAYSAALQDTSTYADEVILGAEALLVTFGLNEEQTKRTTSAALDFASATGTDLQAAINLLGKAFVGNTAALSRYGIVVDEGLKGTAKFDAVVKQIEERFGGSALAATKSFGGQMKQLENAVGDTKESLGKFLGSLIDVGGGTNAAIPVLKKLGDFFGKDMPIALGYARSAILSFFAGFISGAADVASALSNPLLVRILTAGVFGAPVSKEQVQSMRDLAGALAVQAGEAIKAGEATANSSGHLQDYVNKTRATVPEVHKLTKAEIDAAKAAKKHAEEIKALADRMSDAGIAASRAESLSKLDEVIASLGGSARLSANDVGRLAEEAKKLGPEGIEWAQGLMEATNTLPVMRTGFDALLPAVQKTAKEIKAIHIDLTAGKTAGQVFVTSFKDSLKELPKVILGAIQGGGDIGKSIGSFLGGSIGESLSKAFGKTITGALGETLGGALNSILPGIGALVGSAFGGLMDKLFGPSEIQKVNDMRDAFFEAHGGFEKFSQQMSAVSKEDWAAKIFAAKTVEDFNRLVAEAQGLLDMQGMAQEKLNEAVQKYGFTIDELGPKWAAQELDKKAGELLQDYELLKASGIDVNLIIAKMGPNLNEYVQTAVKAGVAIPEAMRPVIDKMFEQGQLLHENGEAFTEAEYQGLSFSKSVSESMQELIETIKQFVAALTGVEIPPIDIPYRYRQEGPGPGNVPEAPPENIPQYALGTPYVPRTGLAFLHQGEAVIPPGGGGGAGELLAYMQQRDDRLEDAIKRAFRHAMQTR